MRATYTMENHKACEHNTNSQIDIARTRASTQDQTNVQKDYAAQCGKWRKEGDRLIVITDTNKHTMDGKLRKMLEAKGVGLVEFSHKC